MDKLAYLGSLSTGYYEDSAVLATFQGQKVTASMVPYKQEAASMTYSQTEASTPISRRKKRWWIKSCGR